MLATMKKWAIAGILAAAVAALIVSRSIGDGVPAHEPRPATHRNSPEISQSPPPARPAPPPPPPPAVPDAGDVRRNRSTTGSTPRDTQIKDKLTALLAPYPSASVTAIACTSGECRVSIDVTDPAQADILLAALQDPESGLPEIASALQLHPVVELDSGAKRLVFTLLP